jgi:hypothetical protein
MAAPRKKPVVKKKPPVKKKPSFLRKDTSRPARDVKPGDLRSQTLTNDNKPRPAKDLNKGGLRAQYLKGANAGGSAVARGLIKKIPVVGAALGFIADAAPAGTGSTVPGQAQKAVQKKMKREIRQGSKLAVTGVKEGITGRTSSLRNKTGQNRPEYPTWKNKGKPSAGSPFSKGKGSAAQPKPSAGSSSYSGYGTFNAPKKKLSDAFTLGSGAQTAGNKPPSVTAPNPNRPNQVAPAASVKKVGRLSRTEREGLSTDRMQRKPKGNLLGFLKKRK